MSGKEIAEKMLAENGIRDVVVTSVPGQLTDHYDPTNKTVNLSEAVYMQRNAAAAAVAAHECGHAIQHAEVFAFSYIAGKYDASNRALKWLEKSGTVTVDEQDAAQDSLKWAARTYVVAALGSLAQLLYFASMLSGGRRD
ncbi:hypothetical protein FQR65_LT18984 [Abscondita terminalis]|nr:hypothetical protein FQR65_LT18984 [Abscondita terminalis]